MIGMDVDLANTIDAESQGSLAGYVAPEAWSGLSLMPWLGTDDQYETKIRQTLPDHNYLIAVDDGKKRQSLHRRFLNDRLGSFLSATADIASEIQLGKGCVIQKSTMISAGCFIGDLVKINIGANIHHDCNVKSYCTLAPGARLLGNVSIGTGVFVGAAAICLPGITVGDGAIIGAGAVVTNDVPPHATVVGVPARRIANGTDC